MKFGSNSRKKMFLVEENKVFIKQEPLDDYDQVFIKEEFSEEIVGVKSEACDQRYDQICVKEEFPDQESSVKDLFSESAVLIKTEFLDEDQSSLKDEYELKLIDPVKLELVYEQENEFIDENQPEFIIPDFTGLEVNIDDNMVENNETSPSGLSSDYNDTEFDRRKNEPTEERTKTGSADWMTHARLYCPKCDKSTKKSRRIAPTSCRKCKTAYLHQCGLCQNSYKQGKSLSHHLRYYCLSADSHFSCEHCTYETKDPAILRDHVRYVHCEDKQVSCSFCHKTFKSQRCLLAHVRSIHERSLMRCDHCCFETKSKHTLVKHLDKCPQESTKARASVVTEGENRKVNCQICHKFLKNKRTLKAHVKYCHERLLLECEYCLFVTKFRSYLVKHMNTFHPKVNPVKADSDNQS